MNNRHSLSSLPSADLVFADILNDSRLRAANRYYFTDIKVNSSVLASREKLIYDEGPSCGNGKFPLLSFGFTPLKMVFDVFSRNRALPRPISEAPAQVSRDEPALVTREDVIKSYRTFLRRDPEDERVIAEHIASSQDVWQLINTFYGSLEHSDLIRTAKAVSIAKCFEDNYLINTLEIGQRIECFLHNLTFIARRLGPDSLRSLMTTMLVIYKFEHEAAKLEVKVGWAREIMQEGDLSLDFIVDGVAVYTIAFSFVPADLREPDQRTVILIARMQGATDTWHLIKQATKAMRDVTPQFVLFAVLQGIADASGINAITGTSAATQVSHNEKDEHQLRKAYDDFFSTLDAKRRSDGLYLIDLPLVQKPLSAVAPGHRLRTKAKRELKKNIAEAAASWWGSLLTSASPR